MGFDVHECYCDEHGSGEVRLRGHFENTPAGRWRELSVTLAGGVAENIAFEKDGDLDELVELIRELRRLGGDALETGLEGDDLDAAVLVRDLPDDEIAEEIRAAQATAREVLAERWSEVEAIAGSIRHRTSE